MDARQVLLALFLMAAPAARAQVGADWTAATGGSIRPGYDLNPCSAANSGALRYNTAVNQFQACYGSGGWATLADASGTTPFYTDRITSGTAGVFVSNTGIINLRTGGITTGYFDASGLLVAPGISITTGNGISSTNGYFSQKSFFGENASALASSVSASHIISGTLYIAPSISYASSNDGFLTVKASTGGAFFVGRQAGGGYASNKGIFTALTDNSNGAANLFFIGLTSGTTTSFIRADGLAYFASRLGVGVASPSVASAVEVSGTVSATAFVGNGAGLTNLNVQGDRITSGTAGVFVSSTGIINFRTGGVTTGYFDASGLLVAPGISITTANGISSTNGYFSGAVVNAPQANAGTSIDWSRGNVQYTSASCGAFTFTNMQDGGVYSLTVKGTTAGTCSFSQSGLTFRMPPNHGSVSTGTMTFYTFTRSGSDVMVNWMPGY
jgi:hypothetical protein